MGSGASSGGGGAPANQGGMLDVAPVAHMLGKMYQMMDGEKWFSKDGWDNDDFENGLGEPDFTEYIGLGVNKYTDVIRISLPRNNVGGVLPYTEKFVATMGELRTIDFESNRIGGTFPPSWCMMKNLTDLNLSRNGLRGGFPDGIGNLSTLKKLKLGQNQFGGKLPLTLSKLTNLTRLELHRNRLAGTPNMLGNLAHLHTLKINENLFTGELPDSFVLLEDIKELYFFSNKMTLFAKKPRAPSYGAIMGSRELSAQNLKVLDVLRKRCHILVMLEEQVGDGGFIAERLPPRDVWPNQPHLYGNGFVSEKMPSHSKEYNAHLAKIRNEERDVDTLS